VSSDESPTIWRRSGSSVVFRFSSAGTGLPTILEAAGGEVWTVLAAQARLWPETILLARGVQVAFHKMEPGDFVVTGHGVLDSSFNGGLNVASAVNTACKVWFSCAMEHAEHWRNKLTIHIPLKKLLELSAKTLATRKWWCGDANTYEALDPEQFRRDIKVMVSFLGKGLNDTQAVLEIASDTYSHCPLVKQGDALCSPRTNLQLIGQSGLKL